MAAVSFRKVAIYGAVIAVLIGANAWRFYLPTLNSNTADQAVARLAVANLPELSVAREFVGFRAPATRDLFGRNIQEPPAPTVEEPEIQAPAAPDPEAIARAKAQKILDAIKVLGILGSASGPVALIEYDGITASVARGQEISPGYIVKSLSLTHLVVRNEQIGLEKLYLINESGNN